MTDEFNDLDTELARLRQELSAKDEALRAFHPPTGGEYWQRRLDEERLLWKKKMDLREDEKKALESKMSTQQAQIERYDKNLRDLEKRLENESKQWEERLRAKETDLLIEKNRILSEDKVREAEVRSRDLLKQVTDLNAKIAALKDEQAAERKAHDERFALERGAYEERIRAAVQQVELLKSRGQELEDALVRKTDELESTRRELTRQLEQLQQQLPAVEKEKQALSGEIAAVRTKAEEEKDYVRQTFEAASSAFVQTIHRFIGPMAGLIKFTEKHEVSHSTITLINELIQKIENETELFTLQLSLTGIPREPFRVALCVPEMDIPYWQTALSSTSAELKTMGPRDLLASVHGTKPQVLIIADEFMKEARKIHAAVPFLPIVISGDVAPRTAQKLVTDGYRLLPYPATNEDIVRTVTNEAFSSIALSEYWDKIRVKPAYRAPALAAALVLAGLAGGYLLRHAALPLPFLKPAGIVTPYAQPTNITYDGRHLWTCDWLGQSIYKHSARGGLDLVKIFCLPGRHFSALTWSGGYLWSVDPWENRIYKHNTDENLSVVSSFPVPGASPSGVAGSDRTLWTCDAAAGEIYQHKMDDALTVESVVKSPGASPSGLYFDGQYLWSADSRTNRIYRHRPDMNLTVLNTYLPPDYGQKGFNVSGIACNGSDFWVCSEKAGRIFRYPRTALIEVK